MRIDDYTKEVFLTLIKKPSQFHHVQGAYSRIVVRKLCAHNYAISCGNEYQITTLGINYVKKYLPELFNQRNKG